MIRRPPTAGTGDGDQNYLATISDLMAGLMFLFIITVTVFALGLQTQEDAFQEKSDRKQEEIDKLQKTKQAREDLLNQIQHRLIDQDIDVTVDSMNGVLHLPEAILFDSGSAQLNPGGQSALKALSRVLDEIVPYYSGTARYSDEQNRVINPYNARLDAIFIEGHTDDQPLRSQVVFKSNWELSTSRAIHTFNVMAEMNPALVSMTNREGQPLFGVSGYADSRPVKPNTSDENRSQNRRIDIRFIMGLPGDN